MSEEFVQGYARGFEAWSNCYNSTPEVTVITDNIAFTGKTVLEVGCGTGRLTEDLAPVSDKYIPIDIDERLVKYINKKQINGEVEPLVGQGEHLPFDSDSVDVIVDGWALSAQNREQTLPEYKRVVKESGYIVLITESWDEPDGRDNSEYVSLLEKYSPNHSRTDLVQELYSPLSKYFDSTNVKHIPVESEYYFETPTEALRAFEFHVTQYNNNPLPEETRVRLWEDLKSRFDSPRDTITISEHSNIFIIDMYEQT